MPHDLSIGEQAVVEMYALGIELSPEEVQRYRTLDNARAWWGTSSFKHKDAVLKMLRNDEGRWRGLWDANNKRWGTTDPEIAVKLIESQKWLPYGVSDVLIWPIVDKLKEAVEEKNAKKRKREEAIARKEKKEREREEARRQKEERKEEERREREAKRAKAQKQDKKRPRAEADAEEPREEADAEEPHEEKAASFEAYIDPKHIKEAAEMGIPENILRDCANWSWLGPICSTPIARIERWFGFPQNRARGRATVLKEDFLEFHEQRAAERADANAPAADTNRTTTVTVQKSEEEIARERQERVQRQRDGWKALRHERKHGSHAAALSAIIEKSQRVPLPKPAIPRKCGYCDALVIEQFLECNCKENDNSQKNWFVCEVCCFIKHEDVVRGACRCDTGDE
jgi:hypothetical protein